MIVARIFISYATPDRPVADEVSSWLQAAGHEPFLDHDLRDGISAGEDWKQRLYHELRESDAVIGLVTSSFLKSHWCSVEVGIADGRGCLLIPLRAEAGVEHWLMQGMQYVDYHVDPQQARARVLQAVRMLDDCSGAWREGESPFPGLEPFTAKLSRVFCGREAEAREVGNRLRTMASTGGMLALVGPSGCGKSSLLNAAVVPLLDSDPAWLVVPTLVPGTDPLPELARSLAATATRLGLGWSASEVRGRLEAGTDGLRRVADDLLAAGPATGRLLVSIDQSEELFTRTTPAARQRFAQLLRDAVAGPVRVVVAMRSEFLDDLRKLPALVGMPIEAHVLAPLDREMLRDVIEQPAKVARLRLENDLAAQLVADTDSGEALPLLAFTLRQLADGLPAGGTLTLSHYHDLGGVQGALTQHADAALAKAVQASSLTEPEVLAGLTHLITIDETGRRARRRTKLTSLAEPLSVALQAFVDRRLLLSDTDDDGQVWLTVAHEALLTGWRPLDTATADITVALRTARAVEQAAAEWNSADRPEHYLWDDKRLTATLATLGMAGDGGSHNPADPPIVAFNDKARRVPRRHWPARQRRQGTRTAPPHPHHRRAVDPATARDRRFDIRLPTTRHRTDTTRHRHLQPDHRPSRPTAQHRRVPRSSTRPHRLPHATDSGPLHGPGDPRERRLVDPAKRSHRLRQGSGVQSGWAHLGQRQQRRDGAVVERDRPDPRRLPGSTPDRPHQLRRRGGVQPGWAHPGQRQRRPDGAVVGRDRPGPPHTPGSTPDGPNSAVSRLRLVAAKCGSLRRSVAQASKSRRGGPPNGRGPSQSRCLY
ncbi:MAG TPA: TIR domain-containing protein, partial [Pseudonocardiaceae bacterium]|nr:TIR domain-containing protein [Pseudonocardiaceae bacterium]